MTSDILNINDDSLDELDFDLIHGTSVDDPTKPLVLYANRNRFWACYKPATFRVALLSTVFFAALCFYSDVSQGATFANLCATVIASTMLFVQYYLTLLIPIAIVARDIPKKSRMHISDQGLMLDGLGLKTIPWSQIREVRAYRVLGLGYLAVVPFSDETIRLCANKYTYPVFMFNHISAKWAASFGIFMPVISFADGLLPMAADDIVELINLRLAHFREHASMVKSPEQSMTALPITRNSD